MTPLYWKDKSNLNLWQTRHFYLSCFVRSNKTIKSDVYEFVDFLIDQGYQAPLDSLDTVDKEVLNKYEDYLNHTGE